MGRPIKYNSEEERKEARLQAYKKQNEKKQVFSVVYTTTDKEKGQRLKRYLSETGKSANSYLKELVEKDLNAKNFQ